MHISLSKNGINVFKASDGSSQYGISKIGEAFMSGVLDHLPSVLAFTAPHPTRLEVPILVNIQLKCVDRVNNISFTLNMILRLNYDLLELIVHPNIYHPFGFMFLLLSLLSSQ